MGRRIYRMCLFVILLIAVAGGVYYYMSFYQQEDNMEKGTFVNRIDHTLQNAGREILEPVSDV